MMTKTTNRLALLPPERCCAGISDHADTRILQLFVRMQRDQKVSILWFEGCITTGQAQIPTLLSAADQVVWLSRTSLLLSEDVPSASLELYESCNPVMSQQQKFPESLTTNSIRYLTPTYDIWSKTTTRVEARSHLQLIRKACY